MQIQLSDHFTYKKLLRFAVSPIMMMIFTSIYGVVDGLFVSNFVGKVPFAAINLIMPFTMILGGMGFMVGTGGSALVAKTLGEGDRPAANRYFTMMVLFTLLLGAGLSVFGIAAMPQAARLLGATDAMMEDCVVYGRVVVAFTAAFMLQNVFQTFLSTAEKPKLGLFYTVAAGVANMALDALFIAVFRWGVAGAALATGVSQLVGGVLPLFYFLRPNSSLLRLTKTRLEFRVLLKACGNGSSELMSNISGSVVGMLYNYQLLRFAGEDGVAVYGVLMYVSFIFVAAFIGYTVASTPIVGYHHGAGNHPELKSLLKKSVVLMLAAGVLMMVLSQVLARPLANVFVGYDQELSQMTQHAFMVFSWSFLLAGFNIFVSSFFTALNNGAISAAISFLRSLVFQIICVLALPALLGLDGIWWSVAVADVFACAISIAFLFAKRKKYHYM
ncbi:MATE family efflux transporter [Acutalibacter sp.]|jgi:putative MATE family efflux protein|uniref:MATE family efflux transporter n=1 Tax=Acutalibacter sp. TaxID=1918636 RepID=UPI00216D2B36|nr:MATE family efflux transporter [Acutalibacter sp.]